MVALNGLSKLRGHKDVVTGVKFLSKGSQKLLVSVSKDTLLKVWDMSTQFCIQTIVGHRNEIWSLAVCPISDGRLVVTGSADGRLRGYSLSQSGEAEEAVHLRDDERVLDYIGSVERLFPTDKATSLHFNTEATVLVAQNSGKNVEVRPSSYCFIFTSPCSFLLFGTKPRPKRR